MFSKEASFWNYLIFLDLDAETQDYGRYLKFYLGHIGDQDWLTLFGMAAPDLVYPLSCLYNRQINEEYNQGIWKPIFKFFYACENATEEAYVLHGNSGESIVRYNALQVNMLYF